MTGINPVRLQETLKLMGVNELTQTLAWLVEYLILMAITVIFLTIFLNIHVTVDGGGYSRSAIGDTSTSVLTAFLFLNVIANISFSFALCSFFKKGEIFGCHGFQLARLLQGQYIYI